MYCFTQLLDFAIEWLMPVSDQSLNDLDERTGGLVSQNEFRRKERSLKLHNATHRDTTE